MLAAELDSADLAKLTVAEMLERHILINRTSDTVLRFLPPYILGAPMWTLPFWPWTRSSANRLHP